MMIGPTRADTRKRSSLSAFALAPAELVVFVNRCVWARAPRCGSFLAAIVALLLLAGNAARAQQDPARIALTRQFLAVYGLCRCTRSQFATAVASATMRRIGALNGDPVVLTALRGRCMSGNANGPWLVIRVTPAATMPLLAAIAEQVDVVSSTDLLPRLQVQMHNSAYDGHVTVAAFRAGRYRPVDSYQVRYETGERQRTLQIAFLPGASSGRVSGKLWSYWGQSYEFYARRGQRLTVNGISPHDAVYMYLAPAPGGPTQLRPGSADSLVVPDVPITLERTGWHSLWVNGNGQRDVRYEFTLAIH
jgi:hypothetical protein